MGFDLKTIKRYTDSGNILNDMLADVPNSVDKRQGSIIWDTLAPISIKLSLYFKALEETLNQTFILTATGQHLDNKAADYGLTRKQPTKAIRIGYFEINGKPSDNIPIGSRFSTIVETSAVNFRVKSKAEGLGHFYLECEEAGAHGNRYFGNLLMLDFINSLTHAELGYVAIPGADTETDAEFQQRLYAHITEKPFAANIAAYNQFTRSIEGVSTNQVYPIWNGGGTVLVSILDSLYGKATPELIAKVQELIDPDNLPGQSGLGIGMSAIGHKVTVTTAEEVKCDVKATLMINSAYPINKIQEVIEKRISEYLLSLRQIWGVSTLPLNGYTLYVSYFNIGAIMVGTEGVMNIDNFTLNGVTQDIILQQTKDKQQIPIMGKVVLSVR